jgi:Phage terminase large subunit/Terminase RNaseH-like domain
MLFGGSRSGKTFLICRAIVIRALKAPGSRHAAFRFRLNHAKASLVADTFPKVFRLCFPGLEVTLDKQDLVFRIPSVRSEIWIGGLDDKERTEKVLGQEFATIFLNECSQIPWASRQMAVTRLAQRVQTVWDGKPGEDLRLRMFYDCNPPDKVHWTYRFFRLKVDPETKEPLRDPGSVASMQINPRDNKQNLPAEYLSTLEGLSARMRRRFLEGEFRDARPDALFTEEVFDTWRQLELSDLPDMQRIVVSVDPSGSGDIDNSEHDAIGIVVAGLGTDGNAYCLEDLTVKAGPNTWGRVVASAYDRWGADLVVAEVNFGGAMVKQVIDTARPRTPFKAVTASRGKAVRAEPLSSLAEQGRIRQAGQFPMLEEELCGFTTAGYTGSSSPNRADAWVWAFSELFPSIARPAEVAKPKPKVRDYAAGSPHSWMG